MKKLIALSAILFAGALLFAADSYTVKEVKGKVTYEAQAGVSKAVVPGQKVSMSTIVNTGVNSSLVLEADGKTYTVKPMSKGTVNSLVSAKVAGGFKKNPGAGAKLIAKDTDSTGKGISTASERGSGKGEEDIEIDE